MAGFQKYPFPRYLNAHVWVINKHWRRNLFHIGVPLFIFSFLAMRNWSVTAYRSPAKLTFVDPENEDAAKKLRLLP